MACFLVYPTGGPPREPHWSPSYGHGDWQYASRASSAGILVAVVRSGEHRSSHICIKRITRFNVCITLYNHIQSMYSMHNHIEPMYNNVKYIYYYKRIDTVYIHIQLVYYIHIIYITIFSLCTSIFNLCIAIFNLRMHIEPESNWLLWPTRWRFCRLGSGNDGKQCHVMSCHDVRWEFDQIDMLLIITKRY